MCHLSRAVHAVAIAMTFASIPTSSQDLPTLSVSPSKANMLVGEAHTFRAVGQDGRMRHNVRWMISPENAATLTQNGDEATVQAQEVSSSVILTAYAEGDTAEAEIEILPQGPRQIGSVIWSVKEIPGCKDRKIIPAVPSAGRPDIYVQEDCPQGTLVRAITDDGRELWRRLLGSGAALPMGTSAKTELQPSEHLNPHNTSVCDAVSPGMTRQNVGKVLADRNLPVDEKQRVSDQWVLEEEGFRCVISFDANTGTVVKKKKTVVTD
ncbi:MAG TPA: hypothetical protein VMX38_15900 [Verrucomicrobiae bacterium]|nr:hypothetical protein [Verrucomicrobiae bacterium]